MNNIDDLEILSKLNKEKYIPKPTLEVRSSIISKASSTNSVKEIMDTCEEGTLIKDDNMDNDGFTNPRKQETIRDDEILFVFKNINTAEKNYLTALSNFIIAMSLGNSICRVYVRAYKIADKS
ncbi:hypothetical protein PV327_006031 [Microctonus hyperodae]|uniref:Uncharacterized protein n=1 Tax=Microctonus hyperodae TaxID=165561 RepID=A0AA39L0G0_MICHY|nr:hypothetical protein PV327_006031 [Microctonus hyperodae]